MPLSVQARKAEAELSRLRESSDGNFTAILRKHKREHENAAEREEDFGIEKTSSNSNGGQNNCFCFAS